MVYARYLLWRCCAVVFIFLSEDLENFFLFFFPLFLPKNRKICLLIGFRRSWWAAARHQHYKSTSKVQTKEIKTKLGLPSGRQNDVRSRVTDDRLLSSSIFSETQSYLSKRGCSINCNIRNGSMRQPWLVWSDKMSYLQIYIADISLWFCDL